MKNTGMIRRIDELGRIVIPKEIRNTLEIDSNDTLEIYVDKDQIVLKKHNFTFNKSINNESLISSANEFVNGNIFVSDKEEILTNGVLKGKRIPNILKNLLTERIRYQSKSIDSFSFEDTIIEGYFYIVPLIKDSDVYGLLFLQKDKIINKDDILFINILKNMFEN